MSESGSNVTNDELMNDIQNTERELGAYRAIANGFEVLAGLPENSPTDERNYQFQAGRYRDRAEACGKFLAKLLKLAEERGLAERVGD